MCNSPPSTGKTDPVIQAPAGEKMNRAALAISAIYQLTQGVVLRSLPPAPIRPRGICVSGLNPFGASLSIPTVPPIGLTSASPQIRVQPLTCPGLITFDLTPLGPSSTAMTALRASTPAFAADTWAWYGVPRVCKFAEIWR